MESFDDDLPLSRELSLSTEKSSTNLSADEDDVLALFQDDDFVSNGTTVTPEDVDSLLAQELTQLSIDEREKVFLDLHGISSEVNETPDMIQESLLLLQKALDSTPGKEAYKKAEALNPEYVHAQGFLLKFLRADRFDIPAAAERLAKFFELKLDLFGEDLLVKDITQDDLDHQDLKALYSGSGYVLPFRDVAGRLIRVFLPQPVEVSIKAVLRQSFYAYMVISEDEETQRKGQIHISYLVGQEVQLHQLPYRQALNEAWARLVTCIPLRIEAFHTCADSLQWRPMLAKFKASATLFTRARFREHIGDSNQVIFGLQTFGIPTHGFPLLLNGETIAQLSREQLKKRRRLEQVRKVATQQTSDGGTKAKVLHEVRVGTPGRDDVLLGRGKAAYSHVGNLRLKYIVMDQCEKYEKAVHKEKQRVSTDIVKLIQSRSGRFLRDDGAGWVEVDDETAMKKVSHAFRTLRGVKNRQKENSKSQDVKRRLSSTN